MTNITDKLVAANSIVIKDFKSEPVILLYKTESGRKINLFQELVYLVLVGGTRQSCQYLNRVLLGNQPSCLNGMLHFAAL